MRKHLEERKSGAMDDDDYRPEITTEGDIVTIKFRSDDWEPIHTKLFERICRGDNAPTAAFVLSEAITSYYRRRCEGDFSEAWEDCRTEVNRDILDAEGLEHVPLPLPQSGYDIS